MKAELQKQLYEKYPKIFVDRDKDMTQSCMFWGIETGDGWYTLIDTVCWTIQSYIDNNSSETRPIPQVVAEQVKEKFGTLRFYARGGNDMTGGMTWFAESMSSTICEQCGKPGKTNNGGWLVTLCAEHRKEDDYELET